MIENLIRYMLYLARYLPHYLYDLNRFVKFSNKKYKMLDELEHRVAKVVTLYHVIEKGLSMESPRPGFGAERVDSLLYYINLYSNDTSFINHIQIKSALLVLNEYQLFLLSCGIDNVELSSFLKRFQSIINDSAANGGTKVIDPLDKECSSKMSFSELVSHRHSVRFFNDIIINSSEIESAISMAMQSPSSCNRQSSRVVKVPLDLIPKVLATQGGANGYSDRIKNLFAICFDNRCYQGVGDRNSGYIDASIFGTSLMYAFTSFGYHTLILNWSKPYHVDVELRKSLDLKPSISVCFFMAVGNIDSSVNVPNSQRNSIKSVYIND
jgi:nitroreductase